MAREASQRLTSRSWKLECSLPSRGAAAWGRLKGDGSFACAAGLTVEWS
jgi:hypothetical protein